MYSHAATYSAAQEAADLEAAVSQAAGYGAEAMEALAEKVEVVERVVAVAVETVAVAATAATEAAKGTEVLEEVSSARLAQAHPARSQAAEK